MKRICTAEEYNLIRTCVSDILTYRGAFDESNVIVGKQFWVNGGTVMNYVSYGANDAWLTIAEDDLRDVVGNYCCVRYQAPTGLEIKVGERILLVYNEDGGYVPLKVNAQTSQLISMNNPDYFDTVDWEKSVKVPHPAILELDQQPRLMNEQEIARFAEKGAKFFPGLFRGLKEKQLQKVRYKKKVFYLYENDAVMFRINGVKVRNDQVRVYEYKNGVLADCVYFTKNTNFLPEHIPYGKVIYKYTEKENVGELGLNYFATED